MSDDFDLKEAVPSWDKWLEEFDREIVPLFTKRGYSKDTALIAFNQNCMTNKIVTLIEIFSSSEDGEDWKRGGR